MSTVHIAGDHIQINQLLRQRCAWCGHVLIDYNLDRLAVPVGQDPSRSTWPVGGLVEVDGNASWVVELDAVDGLPDNACSAAETHEANATVTR